MLPEGEHDGTWVLRCCAEKGWGEEAGRQGDQRGVSGNNPGGRERMGAVAMGETSVDSHSQPTGQDGKRSDRAGDAGELALGGTVFVSEGKHA